MCLSYKFSNISSGKVFIMKVLSLYCGAGGIDEGLRQAGIKTTLAIDHEQDCCKTIKLNHPDTETICGKVSDYIGSLKGFDVIVGGPPCPEFSRANSNRSFNMCEINNFWQVIENNKPLYFLMENVQDSKKKLYKTSYLIDAADYGVPQNRLRRFFTNLPLPPSTHSEKIISNFYGNTLKKWVSVREALNLSDGFLEDRKNTFGENEFRKYPVDRPSHTIDANCGRDYFISVDGYQKCNQIEKTRPIDQPSQTVLASRDLKLSDHKIYSTKYLTDKARHEHQESFLQNRTLPVWKKKNHLAPISKPSSTILTDASDNGIWLNGERKLTNDELQILQGFPKDYKFFGNKGSVRRQIGNAVPPAIIKAFFSQIMVACK